METYKQQFIEFMVRSEVLTFGDFVTKSGRSTPYFVNTGKYRTGMQMERLGEFYADSIEDFVNESGQGIDVLFGPAYKGIPLVVTASIALARRGRDVAFTFNRKEAKDHGEGGVLVGHTPIDGDRVLWVEDVTSAGTSIRETVPVVQAAAWPTERSTVRSCSTSNASRPCMPTCPNGVLGDNWRNRSRQNVGDVDRASTRRTRHHGYCHQCSPRK